MKGLTLREERSRGSSAFLNFRCSDEVPRSRYPPTAPTCRCTPAAVGDYAQPSPTIQPTATACILATRSNAKYVRFFGGRSGGGGTLPVLTCCLCHAAQGEAHRYDHCHGDAGEDHQGDDDDPDQAGATASRGGGLRGHQRGGGAIRGEGESEGGAIIRGDGQVTSAA